MLADGASNWRLDGLKFESNSGGEDTIIVLQDASNITMDRLLIGAGEEGQKRAITGNGKQITLTRSYIANCWRTGQDSQAFAASDGSGPYRSATTPRGGERERPLRGSRQRSRRTIPRRYSRRGQLPPKQVSWKGSPRSLKNLFELKAARRAIIRNNLFERNWTDGQSGTAILFTVRNQDGRSPWSVMKDILFERNIVRDTEGVFAISGYDDEIPLRPDDAHHPAPETRGGQPQLPPRRRRTWHVDHRPQHRRPTGQFAVLFKGDVWTAGSRHDACAVRGRDPHHHQQPGEPRALWRIR